MAEKGEYKSEFLMLIMIGLAGVAMGAIGFNTIAGLLREILEALS